MIKMLLFFSALLISGPALACDVKAEQKDPNFPVSVAIVATKMERDLFTSPDGAVNLLLESNKTYADMIQMFPADMGCENHAAAVFLADLVYTTLKRHKANKVNGVTFLKDDNKKMILLVNVFKDWEDNPFILDTYQWDGKRFKFIKTESFNS